MRFIVVNFAFSQQRKTVVSYGLSFIRISQYAGKVPYHSCSRCLGLGKCGGRDLQTKSNTDFTANVELSEGTYRRTVNSLRHILSR